MKSIIQIILLVNVLLFTFFINKCTNNTNPNKAISLNLQLKWIYNAGFAGDFVAQEKGFWQAENLNIKIQSGGVGIDPIKSVLQNNSQFGVATADQVLLAIQEGAAIIAIAVIYKENPLAWIVQDSLIKSAKDFKGKNVGLSFIDDEPIFNAMLKKVNLNSEHDINIEPIKFDISPFLRGEIDAYPVFINTQGVEIKNQLAKKGVKAFFIKPSDYGIISYSNLYFTRIDFLKNNPDVVRRFIRGIIRGWEFSRDSIAATCEIIAKFDRETDYETIKSCLMETNKLVTPKNNSTPIGYMEKSAWESSKKMLVNSGELKNEFLIDSIFDNKFVLDYFKK